MEQIKNQKDEFINYCLEHDSKFKKNLPLIKTNLKFEAIFIEFRLLSHVSFLIKNAIYQLGSQWSFTIVCGANNYDFMMNLKKLIQRDLRIIKLNVDNLSREEYSIMLLHSNFYRKFYGEKLLIFQEDTIILKPMSSQFLDYDYIGAPYPNKQVGNGGLSLRSKSIMIRICQKYFDSLESKLRRNALILKKFKKKLLPIYGERYFDNPKYYFLYVIEKNLLEDLQITNIMREHKIGKLAPFLIARQFSIEKYYDENAFGGHQFWYSIRNIRKWLDRKLGNYF